MPARETSAVPHKPKRPANALALAVLGLLLEQPMHPHAMAGALRERGMDRTFKLTTGSLYDTVRALTRDGWIEADGTEQVGNRPARTVYRHTAAGREGFTDWLDELIREPSPEYPRFLSAVGYLGALGRVRAAGALRERAAALRERIEQGAEDYRTAREEHGAPRLFVIEAEYAAAMARAELAWVEHTADEVERGTLAWPEGADGE
ncbi:MULTISPECIES: PadR family transcriptional regulator [Streptomyces]|uniref:PadR family transcriptional regulator n=1 Tax=Streptomyces katrae TaxID=68223 RepID=A0ABT7H026_9ACTN|nr:MULTISPECIES: PadR family transcriptional regulator [Streptomyces]MDK9499238.1 PadR family transcriptional regulator [Streptomyces katrae]GLX19817.1 PadR family transcriptional regulator [Streptomyces lavendulae subsp. lavendulae]GLX27313.1 PadR family transcriptional regulator [Streptomyces lavendulae subsp. lavendulae]